MALLSFLLCTVYRSPATPVSFWENLNISLEKAYESNKNIIIVGDLNQDLLNDSSNHLRNIMAINTLTNVINKPTRMTNNTATLLDPILVSDHINVKQADTIDVESNISDHKATLIFFEFVQLPVSCSKRKVWYYDRANSEELNRLTDTKIGTSLTRQTLTMHVNVLLSDFQ